MCNCTVLVFTTPRKHCYCTSWLYTFAIQTGDFILNTPLVIHFLITNSYLIYQNGLILKYSLNNFKFYNYSMHYITYKSCFTTLFEQDNNFFLNIFIWSYSYIISFSTFCTSVTRPYICSSFITEASVIRYTDKTKIWRSTSTGNNRCDK